MKTYKQYQIGKRILPPDPKCPECNSYLRRTREKGNVVAICDTCRAVFEVLRE